MYAHRCISDRGSLENQRLKRDWRDWKPASCSSKPLLPTAVLQWLKPWKLFRNHWHFRETEVCRYTFCYWQFVCIRVKFCFTYELKHVWQILSKQRVLISLDRCHTCKCSDFTGKKREKNMSQKVGWTSLDRCHTCMFRFHWGGKKWFFVFNVQTKGLISLDRCHTYRLRFNWKTKQKAVQTKCMFRFHWKTSNNKNICPNKTCVQISLKNHHQKPVQTKGVNIIWRLSQMCVTREATVAAF